MAVLIPIEIEEKTPEAHINERNVPVDGCVQSIYFTANLTGEIPYSEDVFQKLALLPKDFQDLSCEADEGL